MFPQCRSYESLIKIEVKKLNAMFVVYFHYTNLIYLSQRAQCILEWVFLVNYLALECLVIAHGISFEIFLATRQELRKGDFIDLWPWLSHGTSIVCMT